MTHAEKTEAVIEEWAEETSNVKLLSHARDLARKLDIVMGLLDPPSSGFNWPEYKTELATQARAAWGRTE